MKPELVNALKEHRRAYSDFHKAALHAQYLTLNGLIRGVCEAYDKLDFDLINNYAVLSDYLGKNPDTLNAGVLEKLISKDEIKEIAEITEGKKPSYLTMKEAIQILKSEEIKNGIPENKLANNAAYYARVRYQIKLGNLGVTRKKGRINKIPRKQFEKLIPKLAKD